MVAARHLPKIEHFFSDHRPLLLHASTSFPNPRSQTCSAPSIPSQVACTIVLVAVSTAAHLMQDFKTGYLTMTSPKAMFAAQVETQI